MKIIGHRGAKGLAPENTLASFQAALDAGVDGIEFDVRVTADEVPVIVHDSYILPTNGKGLLIANSKFKELKLIQPDLVTLEEALRFLQNKTQLVIEIKPGVIMKPIIDCLRLRLHNGLKPELCIISSFDFNILRWVNDELPEIALAVNEERSALRAIRRARKLGTAYITMNQKWLWRGFIRLISRRYRLSTYTLNNPAKAQKWAKAGLYAVITDFPDRR